GAARALVLLDDVPIVFAERVTSRHADLLVRAHPQSVKVHAGLVFDDERGLLQGVEIAGRTLVDAGRVRIGTGRQLELGARDAQEAQRVAGRQRARLIGIDDIVGNGGDTGSL